MVYVLFLGGFACIALGVFLYKYFGKKKGRKFLIIGILVGFILIDQSRARYEYSDRKDAQEAYHLIVTDQAELYIDGKEQKDYPENIDVYEYRNIKVDGNKVYLNNKIKKEN